MANGRLSALARLNKQSISVKDMASQLWCEKQMELGIIHGVYSTPAMSKGSVVHAIIQEKVFVKLPVEPVTYMDRLYKWAYENYAGISKMQSDGYCREIHVYGSINGFRLSGQIDELRIVDGKVVVVEDKTISGYGNSNGVGQRFDSDKMQLNIYKSLLDDIKNCRYNYDNFAKSYGIEGKPLSSVFLQGIKSLGIKDELLRLEGIYKKMFTAMESMPEISDTVELRYLNRSDSSIITDMKIPYDKNSLNAYLKDALGYWSGDRDARPVSEANKSRCNFCKFFGKECTVWWPK
jgi:hypothetical protein